MKLSDYLLEALADAGAEHVFFVPGGAAMHLNDSLRKSNRLGHTCLFHEQAAAVAAEAFAKTRGALGVAMVTAGPGSTNAITGVASAWVNSAPLVVLSGQVKKADINPGGMRQNGLQEVDIVSIVRPITKYAATVTDPASARAHIENAISSATTGRQGPVWLNLPLDIQSVDINPSSQSCGLASPLRLHDADSMAAKLDDLIARLNQASRPICLAGYGIRASGSDELFMKLVDVLGIPVQTTWMGCDLIDHGHPLFAGRPGSFATRAANFAIQNSDFVLAIGSRLDFATTGYSRERFARDAYKVAVDVDHSEIKKLIGNIDLGLTMDAKEFIQLLLGQAERILPRDRSEWHRRIRGWEARYPLTAPPTEPGRSCVSSQIFFKRLSNLLGESDILVDGSAGIHAEIFFMAFDVKAGQRVIADGSFGSMGYGLPAAIGSCLAGKNRRTVLIEGDGSLQPQLQELETIRRHSLPIKIFVVNNDGYASIRVSQKRYFNGLIGADSSSGLSLPDLSKISAAFGVPYRCVDSAGQLDECITSILQLDGPAICEVMVPREEDRVPRIANYLKPDGRMVSRPMEDMFPFLERSEFLENMIVTPLPDED